MHEDSTRSSHPGIRELAELAGIEWKHIDGRGQSRQATDEMLRVLLGALGIKIQSELDIQKELERLQEERWTQIIEPVLVHYSEDSSPFRFPIAVPAENGELETMSLASRLTDEQGKIRSFAVQDISCKILEETVIRHISYCRLQVSLPGRLPLGYYDLKIHDESGNSYHGGMQSRHRPPPRRCYSVAGSKKAWGIGNSIVWH